MARQQRATGADQGTFRRNHGRGHSYTIDGQKVIGVTTVLREGLPSGGLLRWYAETVAGCAIDEWDTLAAMTPSERLKYLAKAPDRARDTAGIQGTKVHQLAEPLAHGLEVEVPEALRGHVDKCVAFLDDWHAQPLLTEFPVFSREWMYGGSPDAIMDVDRPEGAPVSTVLDVPDRWRVLIDWKTKRSGPYGTDAFQLAAYRYAEFYLDEGGAEVPMPPVDECWIVWVRADGYDVVPMTTSPQVHKQFLYAKMISQAMTDARDYRLDALTPPRRTAPAELTA